MSSTRMLVLLAALVLSSVVWFNFFEHIKTKTQLEAITTTTTKVEKQVDTFNKQLDVIEKDVGEATAK